MAVKIAPSPRQQFVDANGVPYSGAKLFTYAAGSTTKQTTYTDSTGSTANSNPIILDSAGRTPYGRWYTSGLSYKEVLAPSTDTDPPTSPIFTEDYITGVNDTSVSTAQWQASGLTPTYIGATQFSVVGDQTTELHVNRRLKLTVSAGTVYGKISVSAYTTLTTITVVLDSGALDSGLSAVDWSILTNTNNAIPSSFAQFGVTSGTVPLVNQDVTSWTRAATTTLGTTLNGTLSDTSTTITEFNGVAGVTYHCRALGTGSITHHSTNLIITQTGASITTAAGDTFDVEMLTASTCRIKNYQRASGVPLSLNSSLPITGTTLSITGGQIVFPASQNASSDANTLDDYEKGTFTPVSIGTITAGTGTYTAQVGRYVKIGPLVSYSLTLAWSAHTGTGDIQFTGLPFSSASAPGHSWEGALLVSNLTFSGQLAAYVAQNTGTISLVSMATGVSSTGVAMDTTCSIGVVGQYTI